MTEFEPERVVIRDNRKIDPVTGEPRRTAAATDGDTTTAGGPHAADTDAGVATEPAVVPSVDAAELAERTQDLQRVQAEYANYRKRAERERLAAGDLAVGRLLTELLPVADDVERARAHGDLTGALKAVAEKLDGVFAKVGLTPFGQVGDEFDPAVHEAVLHDESDAVSVPTCTTVMRAGYQHHDRLLRPAMVGVTDPLTPAPATASSTDLPVAGASDTAGPQGDELQDAVDQVSATPPGPHL